MAISPDHSIGETTIFPEAFKQTLYCNPNLMNALGDGIYAYRWITNLVSINNATFYFLPRGNVTFKSKGFTGWSWRERSQPIQYSRDSFSHFSTL